MEVPMIARLSAGLAAPVLAALCLLTAPVFAQGAKPTDPQIAHIAYTAGQLDIDAAKQALEKSKNKEVRDFAQDMVRDHTEVIKQALALLRRHL
jgi:putative membrane protein